MTYLVSEDISTGSISVATNPVHSSTALPI
jgi:hypothetical protein